MLGAVNARGSRTARGCRTERAASPGEERLNQESRHFVEQIAVIQGLIETAPDADAAARLEARVQRLHELGQQVFGWQRTPPVQPAVQRTVQPAAASFKAKASSPASRSAPPVQPAGQRTLLQPVQPFAAHPFCRQRPAVQPPQHILGQGLHVAPPRQWFFSVPLRVVPPGRVTPRMVAPPRIVAPRIVDPRMAAPEEGFGSLGSAWLLLDLDSVCG